MSLSRVKINFMASTDLSSETRSRILETAWEHVRERGVDAVSVKEIAAAAGVSRQLIYFHYGNRAGLLLAMARHQDRRSGFGHRVAAARELPPVEAFDALIRAWCEYVPQLLPVARALEAALITGDEGGAAWQDRFGELHRVFRHALERVARHGRLAPGWSVETATDWAWARAQPSQWDYLVSMRSWSPDDWVERMTRSVSGELVSPGPSRKPSGASGSAARQPRTDPGIA
jgi:AcrR family transcriptional regulator